MIFGSLDHLRRDAPGCAVWLAEEADIFSSTVTVVLHDELVTVLEVTFDPPQELADYPTERLRIIVRSTGEVYAVPIDPQPRRWKHRYPGGTISDVFAPSTDGTTSWGSLLGPLCLEYPRDPTHLRWGWHLGIDGFVRVVQRHVWSEEFYRRHDTWPGEDVPHGDRPDGLPHPVLTPEFRDG